MLPKTEKQRHHRISLLSAFTLRNSVCCARLIIPQILRRSPTREAHKWERQPPSLPPNGRALEPSLPWNLGHTH